MTWTEEEIEDVLRYYFGDVIVEAVLRDLQAMKNGERREEDDDDDP